MSQDTIEVGSDKKALSVDSFRQQLRKEVGAVCESLGRSYDKEQDRGFAFQIWVAELLLRLENVDEDAAEVVYQTNDLKIDIAFEDVVDLGPNEICKYCIKS